MATIDPTRPSPSPEFLRRDWENAFWPLPPLHPYNDIKTLADAVPWLEKILRFMRDGQYLVGNVGREHGIATINNLFRLFDELDTRDRPARPTDLSDFFKVEAAVSDLLYWVKMRLLADAQVVTTSVKDADRPIPDDRTSEVSNNPEPTGKRGRNRTNPMLDDAVASAVESGKYNGAKDIAENCPEVRGLLKGVQNPVQAVRAAMRRIRSARTRAKKRVRKGN